MTSIFSRRRDPAADPLDAEVRRMLDRRAASVRPSPDGRERLAARLADEGRIVVHLGRSPAARARRRWAHLLALAALVAALAAAAWFSALDSITDAWGVLPAHR